MSVSKDYRTGKIKKLTLSGEKPRYRFCDECLDLQNLRNSIKKPVPNYNGAGFSYYEV